MVNTENFDEGDTQVAPPGEYNKGCACEKHKGNWHLKCKDCYENYKKMLNKLQIVKE